MAIKQKKRHSELYVIREMENKITLSYHQTPVKMFKKTDSTMYF